ncbi:MAG: permease-like cell division protein FtsX [Clostridia bacterium]|nr:permease-like cell division protein FtsX [Clostridia bacterium]
MNNSIFSKIRVFFYMLRQGAKNILQNMFMIFASVSVIFASLMIIGALVSVSANMQTIIDHYNDRPEIRINFKSHVTEDACLAVKEKLSADPCIEEVTFISAEENMQGMLETFEDDGNGDLFAGYTDNEALRFVSLDVDLDSTVSGEEFENYIYNQIEGVDSVRNIAGIVNKLETVKVVVRTCSVIAIIVFGCLSVLLVFNTVKLTVFARRREIEIMKYIGATDVFIVGPFIIEGFFVGLVGSVISYGVLKGVYSLVYEYFMKNTLFGDSVELVPFESMAGSFLLWFVVAGVALGVSAGSLAVKRHVKV